MNRQTIGIIMNDVTGRLDATQHLARSIVAIRDRGVRLPSGATLQPDPILVGRNEQKLRALGARHGIERWSRRAAGLRGEVARHHRLRWAIHAHIARIGTGRSRRAHRLHAEPTTSPYGAASSSTAS